jgi:hypothetical protein
MKALQITLFLIANVIFLSQAGRNVHHLIFGAELSVLDKFEPEKEKARSEAQLDTLLAEYQSVSEKVKALQKEKKESNASEFSDENSKLFEKKLALQSEITQREEKARELRDLWIYSGYGFALIVLGAFLYRCAIVWPGFAILVSGFAIIEYWASPSFFGGGAISEYHQLLVSKTVLTFVALIALYVFWWLKEASSKQEGSH